MIELTLFLIYVMIDAIIDKDMILKRRNVHTIGQYILRGLIIGMYGVLWRGGYIDVLCLILIYWFWFDGFFGYIYKGNIFYLSRKGLDGLQLRYMGQPAWFWFKFILAFGAATYIINPNLYEVPQTYF
jgi:hypothetical protein